MTNNTVQNDEAKVENQTLTEAVKDKVVKEAAQNIFKEIINLDVMDHIAENITTKLSMELKKDLLFPKGLDLTEEEKETLSCKVQIITQNSKDEYIEKLDKEERTKDIVDVVQDNLENIIEKMLSSLAKEVNRGVLISAQAVAADCKNEKHNKIELNHSKLSGDITIPTNCLLLSTNCVDIIKESIKIDSFDPETGEIDKEQPA